MYVAPVTYNQLATAILNYNQFLYQYQYVNKLKVNNVQPTHT